MARGIAADVTSFRRRGLAVAHDARFCRRAAHVEGDHLREAEAPADQATLTKYEKLGKTDDPAYQAVMNKVYAEYFPGDKPARWCIVCGLVRPDALVEIGSIAHIGKK